jgi:hypothetical protein
MEPKKGILVIIPDSCVTPVDSQFGLLRHIGKRAIHMEPSKGILVIISDSWVTHGQFQSAANSFILANGPFLGNLKNAY